MKFEHIPVLLKEVIEALNIQKKGTYLDCTLGGGGHSKEILSRLEGGELFGFDRDEIAIKSSSERLKAYSNKTLIHDNFKNAPTYFEEKGVKFDGVLLDLGVSSPQIDDGDRGFSILHDGRLDMRMDKQQDLDAHYVVNFYPREKLLKILYEYGEEKNARVIVDRILARRTQKPIDTTFELKEVIESAFPKKLLYSRGNVSQQSFQAIRIEVNQELIGLEDCLRALVSLLKPKGRMAVISFHSLEDRIVKNVFKELATDCICPPRTPICICGHKAAIKQVTKKPITASEEELKFNSRSKSAKLRVIEKL